MTHHKDHGGTPWSRSGGTLTERIAHSALSKTHWQVGERLIKPILALYPLA